MRRSMDYQNAEIQIGVEVSVDEGEKAADAYARAKSFVFEKVEADVEEATKIVMAASEKADREKADKIRAQNAAVVAAAKSVK